jgi:hypothetical integral membrane protein (TIGR02206 family)
LISGSFQKIQRIYRTVFVAAPEKIFEEGSMRRSHQEENPISLLRIQPIQVGVHADPACRNLAKFQPELKSSGLDSPFFAYNRDFTLFGYQHGIVLLIVAGLSILLPLLARRRLSPRQQLGLSRFLAITLSFWAAIYVVILLVLGDFDPRTDLPLDICNITALLLPFLMWNPTLRVHGVLYFWIVVGTLQANLTPHLHNGFPHFIFIKYWMVHGGLIVYTIYITVVFEYYPDRKSIWRSFGLLQVYMVSIFMANLILGSNYLYLIRKPPTASVLDYLGPWPVYVLVAELLALAGFHLAWAPLAIGRKGRS